LIGHIAFDTFVIAHTEVYMSSKNTFCKPKDGEESVHPQLHHSSIDHRTRALTTIVLESAKVEEVNYRWALS
jgi:hypothetical protein